MITRIQPDSERWVSCGLSQQQNTRRIGASEVPSLPLDLTTWVDKPTLLIYLEREILGLDWINPLVVEHLKRHPDYHPKSMLSLLCLGYSTQVFSSQEIRSRCHVSPEFALLCDGQVPFAEELTRFRRKHRALIAEVLARLFKKIWQSRCDNVIDDETTADQMRDIALARLDIARHMDACD